METGDVSSSEPTVENVMFSPQPGFWAMNKVLLPVSHGKGLVKVNEPTMIENMGELATIVGSSFSVMRTV